MFRRRSAEAVFTRIYRRRAWGGGSPSGPGSGLERTAAVRAELAELVRQLGVESMLDAGCGDFRWLRAADLPLRSYVGVDIVGAAVAENRRRYGSEARVFVHADITLDPLPRADLVLCRECLVHLPDEHVLRAVANFRASGAAHLLATTFAGQENREIELGGWRPLNLQAPPFSFPEPVRAIRDVPLEGGYEDKRLALWRLEELRGDPVESR